MYNAVLLCCILALCCKSLAVNYSTVTCKDPSSECGLSKGGAIIQKVTHPSDIYKGFFWDNKINILLSVSPKTTQANAYVYESGRLDQLHIKELEGCKLVKQIPLKGSSTKYILVTDKELYVLTVNVSKVDMTYTLQLYKTLYDNDEHCIVSATTDPEGKLWLGVSNAQSPYGSLLKVSIVDNTTTLIESKYTYTDFALINNHKIACIADDKANVIRSYKFDGSNGSISDVQVVFNMTIQGKGLHGRVSCITADTDGNLWFGLRGGGAVVQYNPYKQVILQVIGIPATDVEAVKFGGPKCENLFVGTKQIASEPDSGSIFAISGTGWEGMAGFFVAVPKDMLE